MSRVEGNPRLLRRGKEAPLRVNFEHIWVNPEHTQAFRPGSRRVDYFPSLPYNGCQQSPVKKAESVQYLMLCYDR